MRKLGLYHVRFNDNDMKAITKMVYLDKLQLRMTQVTSRGLVHLSNLDQLKSLVLEGDVVSKDAMYMLGRIHSIEHLTIYARRTDVLSNESVIAMARQLANLKQLDFVLRTDRSGVTKLGIEQIRSDFPNLTVREY